MVQTGSPFHALVERELQVLLMVVKGMSAQKLVSN